MATSSLGYPSGWQKYVNRLKETGRKPSRGFAVWATRFRVARSLEGIRLEGMSGKAEKGYFVGLKVALADTALEALESALDLSPGSIQIHDPDLSFELWEHRLGELGDIYRLLKNKKLKSELEVFFESDKDSCQKFDLRAILRALRHLNSHGEFTPTSTSLYTSQLYRDLILGLADVALNTCEHVFLDSTKRDSVGGQSTESLRRDGFEDLTQKGFLSLGAISNFSLSQDGKELCARFPMGVPSIHINFETREEFGCPNNHLDEDDQFIELLRQGTPPYGELVRGLGLASHGTVNVWKVADTGYFLATEKEFNWVPAGQSAVRIPVPSDEGTIADFLRFWDLSLMRDDGLFMIPTDSGGVLIDASRGLANRIFFESFKSLKCLRYSKYLDAFVALEFDGLGVRFWTAGEESTADILREIIGQFSRELPPVTWCIDEYVPYSVVAADHVTGAIITFTDSSIQISPETGAQNPWFEEAVEDLTYISSEGVFLASAGHKSGLLRKISFRGEVIKELGFGESPRIRVSNMAGGHALVSNPPGTVAILNVQEFIIQKSNDLGLTSITSAAEVANGDIVVAGFRGEQFALLQLEPEHLKVTASTDLPVGSHRAFLCADRKNSRVILGGWEAPELLVWSSGIEGTADRLPLAMTPRCAVISPSGEFLYVAYKDAQSIAVVDLNSLEERHRMPVPAETCSLDISEDGKSLLALGDASFRSFLSVIPLPIR